MSQNVPTDNNFSETQPPTDDTPPEQKITQDQRNLAKIGNDPNWGIIMGYLDARIEIYKNGLFGEDLTAQPTEIIGQRFLAAQSVIQEFQSLKNQVAQTTEAVNEALKGENTSQG